MSELAGATFMVFTRTCDNTRKLALMLRNLGLDALPIHGQMSQPKRLGALTKFKAGERSILVATGQSNLLNLCSNCCTSLCGSIPCNYDLCAESKVIIEGFKISDRPLLHTASASHAEQEFVVLSTREEDLELRCIVSKGPIHFQSPV
jgi:hypothetical protein